MIKAIAFTIYAVTDLKKSKAFYEGILGLTPSDEFKDSEFWVEYNIGEGTFALGQSPDWKPSVDGASVAFEVENFDETIKNLKEKEVTFFMEPMDFPGCKMCVIQDPDKNKICIHHKK